ncbi:MAG: hypothetical protein A2Z11_00355 [Candidatus Woykebacteria bacterium RBG_16_43_9]|uniref:Uncharacterized protein n=1 Tax=Candidatus Woykebacteria bacterium RBG_16_43_9 TaxID=1802596 RepID=A0A1G1WBQ6_9BACT|nr:MAG: hypothetical protein A2Z11_00355 [Candidatus Woykebacteria bacterium RBG_16_43_9]
MKSILIAGFALTAILAIACSETAEEGIQESTNPTEVVSVNGLFDTGIPFVGEMPTPVASSMEATPVPTIAPEPAPTPSALPPDTYSPTPEEIQVWERLTVDPREVGDKLLVETDHYKVNYRISNRQVSVLVKAPPFEESKTAAEEWFVSQGLSPQSLCVIVRINFVPSQEVMDSGYEFQAEDSVPTGCDVPNS